MKFLKWVGIILLSIIALLGIIVVVYLQHPMFGARPSGDRLVKIQQSPNYHDGQFWNLSDTPMITPTDSQEEEVSWFSWLMPDDSKRLAPKVDIPSVKTDLKSLKKNENIVVWLGHSAYFMILDGKTYLVDPTLISGSPVWFVNKPFKGTSVYSPNDIPEVDYLIITHDHYDHLDYFTMKKLKDKVGKVITSLGVGAHLEKWGFEPDDIIEMDWYDESDLNQNIKITCLPARHYSGRLWQNNTLWSSFMLETENKTVYIGGDSGYDKFFQEIGQKRRYIDLALIENGQYDEQRRYIHLLPDDVVQVIKDLNPKKVLAVHNSKYSMANHARDEPMILLDEKLQAEGLIDNFGRGIWLTPMIGDVVDLDKNQTFSHWWVDLDYEDRLEYKGNRYLHHSSINKNRIGNQLDCLLPESRRSECDELEFYQRKDHSDDEWLIQCKNDNCVTYLRWGVEEYPTEEELGLEMNCISWDGSPSDLSCGEFIFESDRYFSAYGSNPEWTLTVEPKEIEGFDQRYDVNFNGEDNIKFGALMHLFIFGEKYKLLYDGVDIKFIKGECDDGIQGNHKKAESNYKVIMDYRGEKVYEGCGDTRQKEDANSEKEPEAALPVSDSRIQYLESLVMGDSEIGDEQDINEDILPNIQDTMDKISTIKLTIGNKTFQLKLVENLATEEFVEKLKEGNIVIKTYDYGGFEKVGELGFSLPREDSQITTNPGDIVLYQGNQFSLFYESNSWSYTKIGTIQNISQSELKDILGEGDVELIFSIN